MTFIGRSHVLGQERAAVLHLSIASALAPCLLRVSGASITGHCAPTRRCRGCTPNIRSITDLDVGNHKRFWAREGYSAPSSASATRTDTPLVEVPQSVQVVTQTMLKEQDSHSLADALVNVSGVRATKPQEALFAQPIVRGFPAEIYMNGLPAFGGTAASIDPTSLIGTERIEVLKGPTSALYGGGIGAPLGGLINVVSKRPEAEPSALLSMRTGSFGTENPSLDLNTPIGDKVATATDYRRLSRKRQLD